MAQLHRNPSIQMHPKSALNLMKMVQPAFLNTFKVPMLPRNVSFQVKSPLNLILITLYYSSSFITEIGAAAKGSKVFLYLPIFWVYEFQVST